MTPRERNELARTFGLISQLGITVVAAVAIGCAVGVALDRGLGLGAPGLIAGLLLGVGGGVAGAASLVAGVIGADAAPAPLPAKKGSGPCPKTTQPPP